MRIHVAAAAILDSDGRVLVSQRAEHTHQGGLWEFPGGKLEADESALQALTRELKEELDILPREIEPLIRIHHDYGDREVLLDFFRVSRFSGEARGMEGQPLRWLHPGELQAAEFPAADRPVITALRLPDRYLITGDDPCRPQHFLEKLAASLDRGIRLVQLRAHDLDDESYRQLLDQALPLCRERGAELLINRPADTLAWQGLAQGIHLSTSQLMTLQERPSGRGLVGASCHSPQELAKAVSLGLDYLLLSPVLATASHPQAEPLGWQRFSQWVERINLPVYALGGMGADQLLPAKQAGAQGIAAIGAFWSV